MDKRKDNTIATSLIGLPPIKFEGGMGTPVAMECAVRISVSDAQN